MKFDPVSEELNVHYSKTIKQATGVFGEDNPAEVSRKISGYDQKEECWTFAYGRGSPCFARMRGEVVSINFGDSWGNYTLNAEGKLAGQETISNNLANATVDLYE